MTLWIPADRLLAVVALHPNPARSLKGKACQRTLRELHAGRHRYLSLRAADSILTNLNLVHWWQIPKEDGGLADIYIGGVQYGGPDRSHTKLPRPSQRRYATEEERLAARRQTYRDSYRRRLERAATA